MEDLENVIHKNKCCVPDCGDQPGRGHRFPKDIQLLETWVNNVGIPRLRTLTPERIHLSFYVCDRHFAPEYLVPGTNRGLRKDAVPTLFLPAKSEEVNGAVPKTEDGVVPERHGLESYITQPSEEFTQNNKYNANLENEVENQLKIEVDSEIKSINTISKILHTDIKSKHKINKIPDRVESGPFVSPRDDTNSVIDASDKFKLQESLLQNTDFNKVCRTCLSTTGKMVSILNTVCAGNKEISISEMIVTCAAVRVDQNDKLPKQLCNQCVLDFKRTYLFQQLCKSSDVALRKYFKLCDPGLSCENETGLEEVTQYQFACDVWSKRLATSNELKDHKRMHSKETQYNYENCQQNFSNNTLLCTNIDSTEIKQKNENNIDNSALPEMTQCKFTCDICTESFISHIDLKIHGRMHSKTNQYICKICRQQFASSSSLCRHIKIHKGIKSHLCSKCGKGFTRSDDLTQHMRTHTGEKPYVCTLCDKSFTQPSQLQEHLRAHAGQRSFVCTICGKTFSRYNSFSGHMKIHDGMRSHPCSACGKRLSSERALKLHMKIHTGQKDHVCTECGKAFTYAGHLIIHMRTHTGERPYVCQECGKAFPAATRLRVHFRIHSGERPYICEPCGKGFVTSSELKQHFRIHTGEKPYKCKLCPKAFPRSENLKIHLKGHTNDRDHLCSYCNKGFYQASTLKAHIRIHTGEKPYKCTVCSKCFAQTGTLSAHLKIHSK